MKLFEAYIYRRIFRAFLLSCLFIVSIAWTIQILQHINIASNNIQSTIILLKISYLIFPTIIAIVVPFCFITEVTQTLASMHKNSELLIIDNTGYSRIALIKPVLFLATFLSIFLLILENTAEPKFRLAIKNLTAQAEFNLILSALENNVFSRVDNGIYISVTKRYPNNTLQGVFMSDARDHEVRKIYYAQKGFIDLDNRSLILQNGELQQKLLKSNDVSIMKFDYYSTDIQSIKGAPTIKIRAEDQSLSFLLNPDPNDPTYNKKMVGAYQSELHQRITKWLFPIIFGLVAIVATEKSGGSRSSSKIHPTFISLSASFGIFWTFVYIAFNIEKNANYIPVLYLFLACVLGILIFIITRKHARI
ncbi:MAG: permease [Candidatus Liberibacter europaeus]|uniref:Permease n=1 Tax=Candidatus Liberibacter europaeus TaxID=744859 RepID=A0A2T4VXR2_9HYPH|nr:permease [Candidatus Liberibacter europaeus]PTL86563.1 MAG: permease [Candidatus Liberibacter europaeus]